MAGTSVRINENGRIVIPARFREALGAGLGDEVLLRMEDGELRITTRKKAIERAQQLLSELVEPGRSITDEFIQERRQAARDE